MVLPEVPTGGTRSVSARRDDKMSALREVGTVLAIYDFEPIPIRGAQPLRFRLEILRRRHEPDLRARVFRYESFRVQPTFPQDNGRLLLSASDETVLVVDEGYPWEKIRGKTR